MKGDKKIVNLLSLAKAVAGLMVKRAEHFKADIYWDKKALAEGRLIVTGRLEKEIKAFMPKQTFEIQWKRAVIRALEARLKGRGDEYEVTDEGVQLVGANGSLKPGRRWSDGLAEATERKEGVPARGEGMTVTKITIPDFLSNCYNRCPAD
jgi:preprotein translocase subunit SecA